MFCLDLLRAEIPSVLLGNLSRMKLKHLNWRSREVWGKGKPDVSKGRVSNTYCLHFMMLLVFPEISLLWQCCYGDMWQPCSFGTRQQTEICKHNLLSPSLRAHSGAGIINSTNKGLQCAWSHRSGRFQVLGSEVRAVRSVRLWRIPLLAHQYFLFILGSMLSSRF